MNCPHPTARMLGGGRCPLCDTDRSLVDEATADLDALEEAAAQELADLDADAARLDLAEFVRQAWRQLEPLEIEWNWHHEALCRNVQGMLEEWLARRDDRKFKMRWHKLLINICPSSLKSRIIMVFAVAWMWLRCPSWLVLCVSANPANVNRDSEACRDLIASRWYRETFGVTWTVREDIDSKAKFATTAGGMRISRGLQSKFTGIHVDGILIDDPDDAHDVFSEPARRERSGKIEAISSRLNDKRHYVMIVSQQRVHVDDASGDAIARGGWLHASYPLLYDERLRRDTPFYTDPRKAPGENLHELRFTPSVIAEARLELGTQGFEAQYQQNPAPREGGMLKRAWFKLCRIVGEIAVHRCTHDECHHDPVTLQPAFKSIERDARGKLDVDWVAISVDATFGTVSDTASAVGLLVVAGKGGDRYILHDATEPMTFPATKAAIRALVDLYPQVTRILVEKKANGAAVMQDLECDLGSLLIPIEPEGGKESRAAAMSPAIEAGSVYVLDGMSSSTSCCRSCACSRTAAATIGSTPCHSS